jgi:hypothetical protein
MRPTFTAAAMIALVVSLSGEASSEVVVCCAGQAVEGDRPGRDLLGDEVERSLPGDHAAGDQVVRRVLGEEAALDRLAELGGAVLQLVAAPDLDRLAGAGVGRPAGGKIVAGDGVGSDCRDADPVVQGCGGELVAGRSTADLQPSADIEAKRGEVEQCRGEAGRGRRDVGRGALEADHLHARGGGRRRLVGDAGTDKPRDRRGTGRAFEHAVVAGSPRSR